jgi:hypothetical protein
MKHSTGVGKTLGAIGIAMSFIKYYRQDILHGVSKNDIGSVYIIGFEGSKKAFQKDLLRFPQLGFATKKELMMWDKLNLQAMSNIQTDINKAFEYGLKIKKRLSNRRGNGFFKFIGYKKLVNSVFTSDEVITDMTEEEIRDKLEKGTIQFDKEMLAGFKNSLFICDEIHNVYNSIQKNNWGVVLQIILDNHPSTRAVFLSATPINNKPSEIVDLLNLLLPAELRVQKKDMFEKNKLLPNALKKIKKLSSGRISYLIDSNPQFFPERIFMGQSIKGFQYLKFVRCPYTDHHYAHYLKEFNSETQTISQEGQYVMDFVLPDPNSSSGGIYRSSDIKRIAMADQDWKRKNNIDVVSNIPTGEFLQLTNLKNVSNKYFTMMNDIINKIKNRQGKIMIYHNYVHMSGILFIREIMLKNGILDEFMGSSDNTLCSICGKQQRDHLSKSEDHGFKPSRFIIVYGDLDNTTVDKSMIKFNSIENSMGENFIILIGARVIKESYNLKAVRNLMVMSRPDNIPMLIQIMGRAVRKNSHIALPPEMRQVYISIYTHSTPTGGLTYEELKYREKIDDYKIVQEIEKVLHENSLDAAVNYDIIKPGLGGQFGDLQFTPTLPTRDLKLSDLNLSTFNVYHSQQEVELATYIIKRAFIETSPVWKYDDLQSYVKAPNFNVEYDTTLISDDSIIVALSKLLWAHSIENINPYIGDINIMDKIFDPIDKILIAPNGNVSVIYQVGAFYMLLPLDGKNVKNYADMPYRQYKKNTSVNVNIKEYLKNASIAFNYDSKKNKFIEKYKNIPIEKMFDVVCDYGVDFHTKFIEECIAYVFNTWTNNYMQRSKLHTFYFKLLYYYDVVGLIIFANTAKDYIYKEYDKFIVLSSFMAKQMSKLTNEKDMSKERDKQNLLNLIARNISKTSCDWCPQTTKSAYDKTLKESLERFPTKKKKIQTSINKVNADILPIGHFLQETPRFYHPEKGWFFSPEYITEKRQWVENPIIIGYDTKSKTGIHIRFKLRKPIQDIKIHKDSRLIEKGSICRIQSKPFLSKLCVKLKIDIDTDMPVVRLCNEIRARLMYLELLERSRGSNIKFYYSHFEIHDEI